MQWHAAKWRPAAAVVGSRSGLRRMASQSSLNQWRERFVAPKMNRRNCKPIEESLQRSRNMGSVRRVHPQLNKWVCLSRGFRAAPDGPSSLCVLQEGSGSYWFIIHCAAVVTAFTHHPPTPPLLNPSRGPVWKCADAQQKIIYLQDRNAVWFN